MALATRRTRRERGLNYWPSYVDALSTLLLVIVFLLSIFVLGQFFLTQEIAGRDTALDRLNRQIAELTDLLALERAQRRESEDELAALQSTLVATEEEQARLQALLTEGLGAGERESALARELDAERQETDRALDQVALLNQQLAALRRQIGALEAALEASERRDRESQARIADLGSRLNVALAQRVQELARFRSDFFGRLRQIIGTRPDIRIVGDRFVFQSEVLFPPGQSALRAGPQPELESMAQAILELAEEIPPDIEWVLRVDGHTDVRPINTAQFPSNWYLSAARAIAVVNYLEEAGVPSEHLLAAGFGEFQPIAEGETEEDLARNRRIEFKLTER
ncbi:peptidoglycan -binding protein [Salinarimonas sp. NSM]|uniref:peptidoglycan -binding protein n=1 Tax=Salinarimonas sp. NSM TaxID=3458003 RepID=UPI004036210D